MAFLHDLPPEIRIMIYRELLVSPHPILVDLFKIPDDPASKFHSKWAHQELNKIPTSVSELRDSSTTNPTITITQVQVKDNKTSTTTTTTTTKKHMIHPAILLVNKTIYKEAIPLLYSQNRIMLNWLRTKHLILQQPPKNKYETAWADELFFKQINNNNHNLASLIRHVSIPFDMHLLRLNNGHCRCGYNYTHVIKSLRNNCPNIQTLEMVVPLEAMVYFGNHVGLWVYLEGLPNKRIITETNREEAQGYHSDLNRALTSRSDKKEGFTELKQIIVVVQYRDYQVEEYILGLCEAVKVWRDLGWGCRLERLVGG